MQAICEPEERYEAYCASSDFIREHVFPGGHLPSVGALVEACHGSGLSLRGSVDIGAPARRPWCRPSPRTPCQIPQVSGPRAGVRALVEYRLEFPTAPCFAQRLLAQAASCWQQGIGEQAAAQWDQACHLRCAERAALPAGPHYATTLRAWRAAWEARRAEALQLGYSDRFWRKYRWVGRRRACRQLTDGAPSSGPGASELVRVEAAGAGRTPLRDLAIPACSALGLHATWPDRAVPCSQGAPWTLCTPRR